MKAVHIVLFSAPALCAIAVQSADQATAAPQVVDIKGPDGTVLEATYFSALKPGPGAILYHQSNRTRKE